MWIDTRNYEPLTDGTYLVQMTSGSLEGLQYTLEGGWNTSYGRDGVLHANTAMTTKQVARWFDAPKPPEIPEEWVDEWLGIK